MGKKIKKSIFGKLPVSSLSFSFFVHVVQTKIPSNHKLASNESGQLQLAEGNHGEGCVVFTEHMVMFFHILQTKPQNIIMTHY